MESGSGMLPLRLSVVRTSARLKTASRLVRGCRHDVGQL